MRGRAGPDGDGADWIVLLEPDTEDNLQRLFEENRWTDYLPIVLPTEERVAALRALATTA